MENNKLKVYLADDQTFVRKGMIRLIQSFARIGEVKDAEHGKELLRLIKETPPDVAILDLAMPGMNGMVISESILTKYPEVKVIILTGDEDPAKIVKLMEMGVHGYLLKNTDALEVERAIYSVVDNDFYHNELVSKVLRQYAMNKNHGDNSDVQKNNLSIREKEVLVLICQELSAKEISYKLSISEKTVHVHRRNIMRKARIKNSIALFRYAVTCGLVSMKHGNIQHV